MQAKLFAWAFALCTHKDLMAFCAKIATCGHQKQSAY
jgi:hypothetical protein